MHLEDLFEKREKSQLELITALMHVPEEIPLKEIIILTDLARSTLLKYIEDLNQLAKAQNFELEIHLFHDSLTLKMGRHITKEDIIQLLIPFSVKIKILNYLYEKDEFTVQKLSQSLTISEATLHRQLTGLNVSLAEFGISIKNGRLRGEEHQIRYFYYHLYWLTIPKKEMAQGFHLQQFQGILETINQFWTMEMSTTNEFKLALWFSITKQRIRVKHKSFKELKRLMRPYLNHRFFKQVRQQMLRYLSRYALEVEEEETMCQFIFITSMSILTSHVMERKLGYGGPVSDATTRGLQFVRAIVPTGENLNEQGLYTLNQVLGQLYFFKGALIDRNYSLDSDLALVGSYMSLEHADYAQEMIQEIATDIYNVKLTQFGDLLSKSHWRIMEVFSFVIYQPPQQLRIGLALSGSQTKRMPVLTALRHQLEINRWVTIDWWDDHETFDFVISNVYNECYEVPYYYLKGAPNAFDIQQLTTIINEHLTRDKSTV